MNHHSKDSKTHLNKLNIYETVVVINHSFYLKYYLLGVKLLCIRSYREIYDFHFIGDNVSNNR